MVVTGLTAHHRQWVITVSGKGKSYTPQSYTLPHELARIQHKEKCSRPWGETDMNKKKLSKKKRKKRKKVYTGKSLPKDIYFPTCRANTELPAPAPQVQRGTTLFHSGKQPSQPLCLTLSRTLFLSRKRIVCVWSWRFPSPWHSSLSTPPRASVWNAV